MLGSRSPYDVVLSYSSAQRQPRRRGSWGRQAVLRLWPGPRAGQSREA